jgi:hypothetical protein
MNIKRAQIGMRKTSGLTGLESMVLVVGMFALLVFLLPAFARTKCKCIHTNCVSNLRQIGTAFRLWADDNDGYYPMHFVGNPNYPQLIPATSWLGQTQDYADAYVYFKAMSNELSTPKLVACPGDTRTVATSFACLLNSNVSYFAGLDAMEKVPDMLLAGDRNVMVRGMTVSPGFISITNTNGVGWSKKIHNESGDVTLADGSAQKFSSPQLQQHLLKTGTNVNRLVFP